MAATRRKPAAPAHESLLGIVTDYRDFNGWKLGKIKDRTGTISTFVGEIQIEVRQEVELLGIWKTHPKYGKQFAADLAVPVVELSTDGLRQWLETNGAARGIGPVKSRKLIDHYGADGFETALLDHPEEVAAVVGIALEWVNDLATYWKSRKASILVQAGLLKTGLKPGEARKVFEAHGADSLVLVESRPYVLTEIDGIGFKTADGIARRLNVPLDNPARIQAGLLYTLHEKGFSKGSTCMKCGELLEEGAKLLGLSDNHELLESGLNELVETKQMCAVDGLYTTAFAMNCERETAGFLGRLHGPNPYIDPDDVDRLIDEHWGDLENDPYQRLAMRLALKHQGALITGGAGVGKSTILRVLASIYKDAGLRVRLCAPTGKAARRIEERTGHKASTIHKLLEYSGNEWGRDRHNQLSIDVLIVDESSMIDATLGWRLLQSVPDKCCVVLVGDHNQLPPVDAGALLRDCIKHDLLPVQVLAECHRQAGLLLKNCNTILKGKFANNEPCRTEPAKFMLGKPPRSDTGLNGYIWVVNDQMRDLELLASKVVDVFTRFVPEKLGIDPVREFQVIGPMYNGPAGVQRLNVLLQESRQRMLGVTVPPVDAGKTPRPMAKDRVICTRNNYDLGIMNGNQGVVISAKPLVIDFDDGIGVVAIPSDCVGDISLSYCLTIHKYQGSEIPAVLMICHSTNWFMLDRNLLYTAATRAQKCLMLLGDAVGVNAAVNKVGETARQTLLPTFGIKVEKEDGLV